MRENDGSAPLACVVGAGIGGLATAGALRRQGWRVQVLERAPGLRATGGGIGLTPNGMRALAEIGVASAVRSRSVEQAEGGVRSPGGRWVARHRLGFVERRYGESIRSLPRIELVRALAEALPEGSVRFGARVQPVAAGGPQDLAQVLVDGEPLLADLLVGADGVRSAVRELVHPGHPGVRDWGAVSWRAIVPADGLQVWAAETWGAGLRFSVLPLPDGQVHFSALACDRATARAGGDLDPRPLFRGWHDPVPQLLERAAAGGGTYRDRIEEFARPLPSFVRGRTVLVGDAAHPMTPNVGSANLALEDAVELAAAIGRAAGAGWAELTAGLSGYDAVRTPRTAALSRTSRWMGRVAETSSPALVLARTAGVWLGGLLPEVVSRRSMDHMVGWVPPSAR